MGDDVQQSHANGDVSSLRYIGLSRLRLGKFSYLNEHVTSYVPYDHWRYPVDIHLDRLPKTDQHLGRRREELMLDQLEQGPWVHSNSVANLHRGQMDMKSAMKIKAMAAANDRAAREGRDSSYESIDIVHALGAAQSKAKKGNTKKRAKNVRAW